MINLGIFLLFLLICAEKTLGFNIISSNIATRAARSCLMEVEVATFGMGCFWAPQRLFDKKKGVLSTKVGYTGGENNQPSYSSVCSGDGHIEVVRVEFDNKLISYDNLLDEFYAQDKTSLMAQKGQYQSAIFTHSDEQMVKARNRGNNNGLTVIREKETFYVAERYHQSYDKKQLPRILLLLTGFIIDVIPNLSTDVYRIGALMTVCYILLFLYERFLEPSLQGKLEKI